MTSLLVWMLLFGAGKNLAAQSTNATAAAAQAFQLTSAFYDGDWMPVQYTCGVADGASPKVEWKDAPKNTVSLALIIHDTDATPPGDTMDVTHWVVWNIPGNMTQLAAAIPPDAAPGGILQGKNVRGTNSYRPPCPPVGARPHRYVFDLYALDGKLDLPMGSSRADLLKGMEGHILGKASLVGIFGQGIVEKSWPWPVAKLP